MESAASLNIRNELSNHRSSGIRAFFLGCAFGFHEVVSRQIKSSDIDNDLKERGLLVAIHHRQNDILKLLLSLENDFEISDGLLIALVTDSSSYDSEALEWLLERQNSINITERVIVAANRSCAEVMTLLLDHSQDLEITDDILESASLGADAGALRALLARTSNPKISTTALSSAVRWGDSEVIQLLLDVGIEPPIITPDVLGQAGYAGNAKIMKVLFEKAEKFDITEKTMMEVAQCREGCETAQMLIDRGGRITQDVILTAAWHGTAIVLELLLQHGGRITEQLIEVGVKNVIDGAEVTKLLLQQAERSLIDNDWVEIMKSAADNTWHGPMVVKQLLDAKAGCQLPEEVLLAVTQNNISGTKILDTMLKDGREMVITSRVIEEAFRALNYHDALSRLLDRYQSSTITAEMLAAAAGNQRFGDEIVGLLLNRSAVVHDPTDEVLKALVINAHSGYEMLRLMENKFGQFTFNEALVEAAVAHGSPETVELILDRQPATPITEALLLMSASSGQAEIMKLLINRSKILATEDTIIAAAGNSQCGRDMTKLLLTQSPHVKVNSAMIQKAAGRNFDAIEILRVLLSRTERIKLSAAVFIDALRDQYCCEDIVLLLLKANVDVEVTEDVFIEVAKSSNAVALVKIFADHGFKLQASENVVEAILTAGNAPLLELLLERESKFQVKINDRMLDSAARNGQKKVLKILSKHKLIDSENHNWYNISRLRNAALEGKVDQMRELIDLGTPADLPDNIGRTPLSWAVAPGKWMVTAGQEEIIELLLAAKADVESRSHNGLTPLCCAAYEGQRRAVKLLLDAGALVQAQDEKGDTPVSFARKQGHLELAKKLENY